MCDRLRPVCDQFVTTFWVGILWKPYGIQRFVTGRDPPFIIIKKEPRPSHKARARGFYNLSRVCNARPPPCHGKLCARWFALSPTRLRAKTRWKTQLRVSTPGNIRRSSRSPGSRRPATLGMVPEAFRISEICNLRGDLAHQLVTSL